MSPGRDSVKYLIAIVALVAAGAARAEPEGYVVAPFENGSPVKQLDWMASALAFTVAEKLEALPQLRPAYGPQILDGYERKFDPEKVARRARDAGAKWVIGGTYARPNWKSELKLRLYTVVEPSDANPTTTLRVVAEVTSVGERDKVLDQVDALLLELCKKAGFALEPDVLAQVKRRPTKDLYAFTLYGRSLNILFALGEKKELDKAIKILKKINLIDPKFAEAHRALGLVYLEANDRGRASGQIAYALELKPGYFAAQAGLARIYRLDGNKVRAQELAEKALEVRPYDVDMRVMVGELLWEAGELERAQSELEKVLAVAPRNLPARRTLALVYAAKGATAELASELEKVQELAPEDLDVKLDLGAAYQRLGANERAIAAYEDVVAKKPRNAQALKLLGDCFRRAHEPEKAIAVYQRVMKLSPEDPRPYFLLGAAYQEAGNDTKAEAIFQEAQQFKRYIGEAWINLGSIAFRRGDLSKANWYLSRAVVRVPMRPKAHYNYALVLSAKKDRDKALDELKVAGDLDPEDAEIRYLAGVILLRLGRLDEARAMFEEALKRRPEHVDAKHNLELLIDLEKRYGGERSGVGAK